MELYHVLKFSPGKIPNLTVNQIDSRKIKKIELKDTISFKIMEGIYCIGNIFNGNYRRCFKKIESGCQCNLCFKYNPFNFCIFCSGTKCYLNQKICGEHFVYLATFGDILKVGVTSINRWPQRVIEQGADYATLIAHTKDGLEARKIENTIKNQFNITDKVYSRQKCKLLYKKEVREIGKNLITIAYSNIINLIPQENQLNIKIINLLDNYIELEKQPAIQDIKDNINICGKVIGSKGNFVVLEQNKGNIIFNSYSLVGRVIKFE